MSELKAMTVLDVQQMGCYDNVFVYFKSEADKVIARHKYKRCLAMADKCADGENQLKRVKMRDMNNHQFWQFDTGYWKKWHKRWLELAEKFKDKEAK